MNESSEILAPHIATQTMEETVNDTLESIDDSKRKKEHATEHEQASN